jgi:hypothetical protein
MALVLVPIYVWRLAGDTLNATCNLLYCDHQVHRDFLIILYYIRNSVRYSIESHNCSVVPAVFQLFNDAAAIAECSSDVMRNGDIRKIKGLYPKTSSFNTSIKSQSCFVSNLAPRHEDERERWGGGKGWR